MTVPGAVSAVIHDRPGTKQPMAMSQPRRQRVAQGWSAMTRSTTTRPTKARGHQPNGGSERQSSTPAQMQVSAVFTAGLRTSGDDAGSGAERRDRGARIGGSGGADGAAAAPGEPL